MAFGRKKKGKDIPENKNSEEEQFELIFDIGSGKMVYVDDHSEETEGGEPLAAEGNAGAVGADADGEDAISEETIGNVYAAQRPAGEPAEESDDVVDEYFGVMPGPEQSGETGEETVAETPRDENPEDEGDVAQADVGVDIGAAPEENETPAFEQGESEENQGSDETPEQSGAESGSGVEVTFDTAAEEAAGEGSDEEEETEQDGDGGEPDAYVMPEETAGLEETAEETAFRVDVLEEDVVGFDENAEDDVEQGEKFVKSFGAGSLFDTERFADRGIEDVGGYDDNGADAEEARPDFNSGEIPEQTDEVHDRVKAEKLEALVTETSTRRVSARRSARLNELLGISREGEAGDNTVAGMNFGVWSIVILAVFLVDIILLNFVFYKAIYPAVKNVMTATGVESLKLEASGFEALFTIISYAVGFIIGGLAVFLVCKVVELLLNQIETKNTQTIITRLLLMLMGLFMTIGLIAMIATRSGLFTLVAYRWFCPFIAYAGGLLFFLFSLIGKKKENKRQ